MKKLVDEETLDAFFATFSFQLRLRICLDVYI